MLGSLLTLTFLEIVLGIDNIILFQLQRELPVESRKKAKIGMFLAMFMRIALLFGINLLIQMKEPWFTIDLRWLSAGITGQSIILLLGGLFILQEHQRNQRKSRRQG
jgi:predicted tellurium resistance membrane protein TerC